MPPFIPMTCPVIYRLLITAAVISATSSAVPNLPNGISSHSAFFSSSDRCAFIGVSITPGEIQFAVMPDGANSFAHDFINASMPPFAAA